MAASGIAEEAMRRTMFKILAVAAVMLGAATANATDEAESEEEVAKRFQGLGYLK